MRTLSASEAAAELGVSVSTIYAYVSRGMIRSAWSDSEKREKRYVADDIERLKRQRDRRDGRRGTAPGTTPLPIAGSEITSIEGGRVYYRGSEVRTLARKCSIGEVAALLWLDDAKAAEQLFGHRVRAPEAWRSMAEKMRELSPIDRFQMVLALAAEDDPSAWDLRAPAAARNGSHILQILTESVAGKCFEASTGVADALRAAWAPQNKRAAELIRSAIILAADEPADHATLAARAIAAAGATPYAVVSGALSAFRGIRAGGIVIRIDALLSEVSRPADAGAAIRVRLERGEAVPGFGDALFPKGDPRAAFLLDQVDAAVKGSREFGRAKKLVEAADELIDERPTLEFALVAMSRALGFPSEASLTLLALARSIGFIAHAIDEYDRPQVAHPSLRRH